MQEKDDRVPEEVKTFTIKKLSEVFPNTESTNDKILEADPNYEYDNSPKHRKDTCST